MKDSANQKGRFFGNNNLTMHLRQPEKSAIQTKFAPKRFGSWMVQHYTALVAKNDAHTSPSRKFSLQNLQPRTQDRQEENIIQHLQCQRGSCYFAFFIAGTEMSIETESGKPWLLASFSAICHFIDFPLTTANDLTIESTGMILALLRQVCVIGFIKRAIEERR